MTNLRVWMAAALLAAGAWVAAPQSATTHQRTPAQSAARRDMGQPTLTDAQLEALIRAKFAKSKINADKFTVHVQGGVATVEGKTDVIQHKGSATRMCRTAGAAGVNNRVQVSQAAKEKAAGNLATGRRRVQVKRGDARDDRK